MSVGIIGYGIQGKKRSKYLKKKLNFIFDENLKVSKYTKITNLNLDYVSSVFLCVPDNVKLKLINFFLLREKNILVEKPLILNISDLKKIEKNNKSKKLIYTAYNHRFEPGIIKKKKKIQLGSIGRIYNVNVFYGNGTSLLVKKSSWKDNGKGVLTDLGSHIIDILLYIFPKYNFTFDLIHKNSFENKSYDHVFFKTTNTKLKIFCEATLLSWKNKFYIDVVGEKGSLHLNGLCKWGPSYFTHRIRKFPSGVPKENIRKYNLNDPTWGKEHAYFFKNLNIRNNKFYLRKDLYISKQLQRLIKKKH